MHEITVLEAFCIGLCIGAIVVALLYNGALSLALWRKHRPNRSQLSALSDTLAQSQSIEHVLAQYAYGLGLFDAYDHDRLVITNTTPSDGKPITYHEAMEQITLWREREGLGPLFGSEKDDSFASSLNTIYASFDGKDLYPSAQEKAASLLYFIVKNHSFTDGNKRIGAAFFVWFLQRNDCLYHGQGQKRIANNALVAITLLIAQSDPANRQIMIALVVNLINGRN